jgi:hypothetical protein
MNVSAVLLWLHTSGVQASCHNMYHLVYFILPYELHAFGSLRAMGLNEGDFFFDLMCCFLTANWTPTSVTKASNGKTISEHWTE